MIAVITTVTKMDTPELLSMQSLLVFVILFNHLTLGSMKILQNVTHTFSYDPKIIVIVFLEYKPQGC